MARIKDYPVATAAGDLKVWISMLLEKLTNQRAFFFILDAREESGPKPRDGFRFVEGHLVVNLAAREMARLAFGLKDWFDV